MVVMNINGLSLSYGTRKILDKSSLIVSHKDKIGIVGVNGAGKTTLFRLITGQEKPDNGEIFISKDVYVGYLKQEDSHIEKLSLYDAILEAYAHLIEIEKTLESLHEQISKTPPGNELETLIHKYSKLTDTFKHLGGYEYESRTRGILNGLGFNENEFSFPVSKLSGGQRTRLMMARLLAKEPDILLLDEPTNHLDIRALTWLEGFIKDYNKTVLVISHDRYFLDKVCDGIFEIEDASGTYYKGNYSAYVNKKNTDKELLQRKFDNQQKEIKRLEDFIEQQRKWNRERNIIAAESRMKAIDRIDKIESPKKVPPKIHMTISTVASSGHDILSVKNLCASYGERIVFDNISFDAKRNDRLFILGPNGCGKSTLIKILTSRLSPTNGEFFFGRNVDYGLYDQDFTSLNPDNTIYEEMLSMEDVISQTEMRNILASFLFKGDDVFKKISILSGGEKSRVLLAKLIISKPNLLILDEPTNHLDIQSREALEELLYKFDGTLICVSHDRYFVNKLAGRILEFVAEDIFDFAGNYQDFLAYKKNIELSSRENIVEPKISESHIAFISAREQKSKDRRLIKRISDTESEISQIEGRLSEISGEMNKPEIAVNHIVIESLFDEKNILDKRLDELFVEWEALISQQNEC